MSTPKTVKLYRKRQDGSVGLQEINRGNFSGEDEFNQAMDFYYEQGFHDSFSEAKEAQLESVKIEKLKI